MGASNRHVRAQPRQRQRPEQRRARRRHPVHRQQQRRGRLPNGLPRRLHGHPGLPEQRPLHRPAGAPARDRLYHRCADPLATRKLHLLQQTPEGDERRLLPADPSRRNGLHRQRGHPLFGLRAPCQDAVCIRIRRAQTRTRTGNLLLQKLQNRTGQQTGNGNLHDHRVQEQPLQLPLRHQPRRQSRRRAGNDRLRRHPVGRGQRRRARDRIPERNRLGLRMPRRRLRGGRGSRRRQARAPQGNSRSASAKTACSTLRWPT